MRRGNKLILGAAGIVGVIAVAATIAVNQPTDIVELPPQINRSIEIAQTPQVGGLIWAGFNYSTPPPLPTTNKWYSPGALAPVGAECNAYLGKNKAGDHPPSAAVWETAPTGCTGYDCANYNIDWSYIDQCVNGASGKYVTIDNNVTVPQPISIAVLPYILDQGGVGTVGDPYSDEQIPDWLESACLSTYQYGPTATPTATGVPAGNPVPTPTKATYHRILYDNTTCKGWLQKFIELAGARYNSNPQIVLVRVGIGFQAESQPTKCGNGHTGCVSAPLISAHEAAGVTCAEYRQFMRDMINTAKAAFPNKMVTFNAGTNACNTSPYSTDFALRYNFYENTADSNPGWGVLATPIALSIHGVEYDRKDAVGWTVNITEAEGYGLIEGIRTVNEDFGFGGVGEYWANPGDSAYVGPDKWQYHFWTALAMAGVGADYIMPWDGWKDFTTNEFYYVTQEKMTNLHPEHAWVIMRDAEYSKYTWNSGTYGRSGLEGNFKKYMNVLTPTAYPQACNSAVRATATAWSKSIRDAGNAEVYQPCPLALPTVMMTREPTPQVGLTPDFNMLNRLLDRQARQMATNGTMGIALEPTWTYYGDTSDITMKVRYLDSGTDDVTVDVALASGVDSHVIDRANTRVWREATWTVNSAKLTNAIAVSGRGNSFIKITNGATTPLYLHEVAFEVSQSATATPSPTPTYTNTPNGTYTPTFTPSPSPTWSVTPTPISGGLRINEIAPNANRDYNLSGSISSADRWFEVRNGNPVPVNMAGYSIVNGSGTEYVFPNTGSLIPANGFRVVLAEDSLPIADADTLTLKLPNGGTIMSVTWPAQSSDLCYAAVPDGGASYTSGRTCTPGSAN